ncbi:MAG: Glyoxalase/bleomycin resistance protein/dioxygenase, partial [Verrucomicrobiaceae bacterium]|nr:Glyoxalase/bleomycin resistance protein/dioxygenase [Verrucomicrobiaceae bacterium]
MKNNIVWFDIPALDLDRAIRFYSAVLGRAVKKEAIEGMDLAMLPTEDGGQMGCLCVVPDFKPSADGIMVYFG